jgi:hypothetical protein
MSTLARFASAARWPATILLVLTLLAWGASGHWFTFWQVRPSQTVVFLAAGRVGFETYVAPGFAMPGDGIESHAGARWAWAFGHVRAPNVLQVLVPLWVIAGPLAILVPLCWRIRWRLRGDGCAACGYSLQGLAGATTRCPEGGVGRDH